jgi:hypothetical protein
VGCIAGSYGTIGFTIFIWIIVAVRQFVVTVSPPFSADVVRWARQSVVALRPLLVVLATLVAVSIYSVFAGYAAYYASSLGWNAIFHTVVIVLYWHVVTVAAQFVYGATALFAAHVYISGSVGAAPLGLVIKRGLVHNIGIYVGKSIVLTVTAPVYYFARLAIQDIGRAFQIEAIGRLVARVFTLLHSAAVPVARCLDRALTVPSRRATVYSALFGIPAGDANRRVAELDSRFFVDRINRGWVVDALIAVGGLLLQTAVGCIAWATAGLLLKGTDLEEETIYVRRIAGGAGFFLCFAFVSVLRAAIAGVVDTLFVLFAEAPDSLEPQEFADQLKNQYNTAGNSGVRPSSTISQQF